MFPIFAPPPSSKAETLSREIAQLVRERHAGDPTLQHIEVTQALALVAQQIAPEFGSSYRQRQVALVAGLVVAAALAGAVAFFRV